MAYVFHRLAACFSFLSHPFKLYRGLTRNMEPGNLPGHPASSIPELRDKIMEQRLELSRKDLAYSGLGVARGRFAKDSPGGDQASCRRGTAEQRQVGSSGKCHCQIVVG